MKNKINKTKWVLCGIAVLCWIVTAIVYFQPKPVPTLLLVVTGLTTILFGVIYEISNVYDYLHEKTLFQDWDSLMVTYYALAIGAITLITSFNYGDYVLLISLSLPLFAVLFPFFCARIYLNRRGHSKNSFLSITLLAVCVLLLIPSLLCILNKLSLIN